MVWVVVKWVVYSESEDWLSSSQMPTKVQCNLCKAVFERVDWQMHNCPSITLAKPNEISIADKDVVWPTATVISSSPA